jgi:hypothetical protein
MERRVSLERHQQALPGSNAGPAVGAVLGRRKMDKHFELIITDRFFSFLITLMSPPDL